MLIKKESDISIKKITPNYYRITQIEVKSKSDTSITVTFCYLKELFLSWRLRKTTIKSWLGWWRACVKRPKECSFCFSRSKERMTCPAAIAFLRPQDWESRLSKKRPDSSRPNTTICWNWTMTFERKTGCSKTSWKPPTTVPNIWRQSPISTTNSKIMRINSYLS